MSTKTEVQKAIEKLNPTISVYLDNSSTAILDDTNQKKFYLVVYKNPANFEYKRKQPKKLAPSKHAFIFLTQAIRQSIAQDPKGLCSGQLNKAFFQNLHDDADVLFLLYQSKTGGERPGRPSVYRLVGFASCNDLSILDPDEPTVLKHDGVTDFDLPLKDREYRSPTYDKIGGKTLYIDAICAKSNTMNWETEDVNSRIGSLLLEQIEKYAVNEGFHQLKLSALGYVVNYYRKHGYIHSRGKNDPELVEITDAAEYASNSVFQTQQSANLAYAVEKSIKLIRRYSDPYKRSLLSDSDIQAQFIADLREYVDENPLSPNESTFVGFNDYGADDVSRAENILKLLPFPKNKTYRLTLHQLQDPLKGKELSEHYFGYYRLVNLLAENGYAVACKDGIKSERHATMIDCADEGFTMIKPLYSHKQAPSRKIKLKARKVTLRRTR